MNLPRLILLVLAAALMVLGSSGPAAAQSTPPADDGVQLKEALIGNWVMDVEASAEVHARSRFGRQPSLVAQPKKPGQPRTFNTNFTYRPFNQQEYEKAKRSYLDSFRAATNAAFRLNFAQDGNVSLLGHFMDKRFEKRFQWVLLGRKISIKAPDGDGCDIQFTNTTQLYWPNSLVPSMVFKPDRPAAITVPMPFPLMGPIVIKPGVPAASTNTRASGVGRQIDK